MESIQVDRVLRPPGLEGATPRAANPSPPEATTETPDSAQRGPKRATSPEHADSRASDSSTSALPADAQDKKAQDKVREAVEALADNVQGLVDRQLEIRYSEEHSRFVVKILDAKTGEVIREIPPEQLLDAATRIAEIRGLIFDEKG